MHCISPEAAGVPSQSILSYIDRLESNSLSTHSLILARGDGIFFEGYWAPFHKEFSHRMFSVSKSIVSLAIGFCEQEGLLSLNDRIAKHFPAETARNELGAFQKQTVCDMLMMSTEKPAQNWFAEPIEDRVSFYFENNCMESKAPGALFDYDSTGSFVLCALVERLTNMPFMDYLRARLFDKIGVSKEAHCLKCPGGHSWGDSGVLCTSRDLLLIARFILNKGRWNGEQLLNEKYIEDATSCLIMTDSIGTGSIDSYGYGYLIWRTCDNSFFLNGIGCQFAVCVPDKDMIMVYNADNQSLPFSKEVVIGSFFELIARQASNEALVPNPEANAALVQRADSLRLFAPNGEKHSELAADIDSVTYRMKKNPMGIKSLRFSFGEDAGCLVYENEQGKKRLDFGMGQNVVGKFPQEGYSKEVGHVVTKGHYYDCAASAVWVEPHKLLLMAQIIDDYLGQLKMVFSFVGDTCSVNMTKTAEDFLNEYQGFAEGIAE